MRFNQHKRWCSACWSVSDTHRLTSPYVCVFYMHFLRSLKSTFSHNVLSLFNRPCCRRPHLNTHGSFNEYKSTKQGLKLLKQFTVIRMKTNECSLKKNNNVSCLASFLFMFFKNFYICNPVTKSVFKSWISVMLQFSSNKHKINLKINWQ